MRHFGLAEPASVIQIRGIIVNTYIHKYQIFYTYRKRKLLKVFKTMEICYIFPSEIFNLKLWNLKKEETLKKTIIKYFKNKKINSAERSQLKQRRKK